MSNDDDPEWLQRQSNEITLLESMYPDEIHIIHLPGPSAEAEFEMKLDPSVWSLSFVLPRETYPTESKPHVILNFEPSVGNAVRRRLREKLRGVVEAQEEGIECVDLIVAEFKDAIDGVMQENAAQEQSDAVKRQKKKDDSEEGMRVVLWMHHLLATSKRKAIVSMSKELGLAGFSRPGYPGSVYVEGEKSAVREFVEELKTMRWQAIQERAIETTLWSSLQMVSSGSVGIEEVQSLGDIAEGLKEKASEEVASFYLEGMKIK